MTPLPPEVREKLRIAASDEIFTREVMDTAKLDRIIDAFLRVLSESGRVVVPREPTRKMLQAGSMDKFIDPGLRDAYRAMISAAEGEGT